MAGSVSAASPLISFEEMKATVSQFPERDFSGVLDAAQEIASRRREMLLRLKAARVANDVDLVFKIVDELVPDRVVKRHDNGNKQHLRAVD